MSKISDEIRKWCEDDGEGAMRTIKQLYTLADRVDREMVELPLDRDGVPIHVGDTVYGCISGRKSQATGLRLEDAWVILTNHGFGEPHIFTHSSPDSWERIADELDEQAGSLTKDGYTWQEDAIHDFADRIRKLAKEQANE